MGNIWVYKMWNSEGLRKLITVNIYFEICSQYNCLGTIFSGTGNTYNVSTPHNKLEPFLSNVVYLGRKDTIISEVGFLFPILMQRACIVFITIKVCIPPLHPNSSPPSPPRKEPFGFATYWFQPRPAAELPDF